jgi:hypothetical protein
VARAMPADLPHWRTVHDAADGWQRSCGVSRSLASWPCEARRHASARLDRRGGVTAPAWPPRSWQLPALGANFILFVMGSSRRETVRRACRGAGVNAKVPVPPGLVGN